MTRTVHVTNSYHPNSGGIRTFYRRLMVEANRIGRPVRLIVPANRHRIEEVGSHARVYHVRAPCSPWIDSRYRVLFPSQFLLPHRRIAEILREEQPDVVEVCDKYSLCYLAGALRKGWITGVNRPVLVGLTCERMDDNVDQYWRLGDRGRRFAERYMRNVYLPQFDSHIAISDYTADELRPFAEAGRHPRRVDVLPLGVDAEHFRPARRSVAVRQSLIGHAGGDAGTRLLLYAGRLSREKNLGLLVGMLERLPGRYRLLVAGDGPLRERFVAEARRRTPGRVRLLGHLDADRLADTLANVDVFVHPNPREPFGIGPLEAMASGVAVVAADAGGVLAYASQQTAWLASPVADAFADAVEQVFADTGHRRATIQRALCQANQYNWRSAAARFFRLYDELNDIVRSIPDLPPPAALRLAAGGELEGLTRHNGLLLTSNSTVSGRVRSYTLGAGKAGRA